LFPPFDIHRFIIQTIFLKILFLLISSIEVFALLVWHVESYHVNEWYHDDEWNHVNEWNHDDVHDENGEYLLDDHDNCIERVDQNDLRNWQFKCLNKAQIGNSKLELSKLERVEVERFEWE